MSAVFPALLFLYALLFPFYLFESGYPQPASFLVAAGIGAAGIEALTRNHLRMSRTALLALAFGVWTFIINIIHYSFYPDVRFVLSGFYYLFNAALFIFIGGQIRESETGRTGLYAGIAAALIAEFLFLAMFPDPHHARALGSFNNPNQLAYWALLSAACVVVLRFPFKLILLDYVLLAAAGYIQILALSKAGLITYALLMLSLPFSRAIKGRHRALIAAGAVVFIIALTAGPSLPAEYAGRSEMLQRTFSRLETTGRESDDSLEGRGYRRIIENPLYLLLGAGEGGFDRFRGDKPRELHSGLATLLFSYGPAGALVFAALLCNVFSGREKYFLVLLGLILLFGLVHQNIRFSMFWVFLAAVHGTPVRGITTGLPRNAPPNRT